MSFHVMFKGSIIWNMNKPPVAMTMIWLSISRFVQRFIVCSNPSSRGEPSCCAERSGSGCVWFDWSKEEPWILTSSIIWSAHVFLFEVLDFRGLFRSDRIAVDKIPRWTLIYFDHKALPMLIASFLRLYTNLVLLLGLDLALQTISHNIIAKLVHENWNSIPKGHRRASNLRHLHSSSHGPGSCAVRATISTSQRLRSPERVEHVGTSWNPL